MASFCAVKAKRIILLFLCTVPLMISEEVYTWCHPYRNYCLFSYGRSTTVSNNQEASQFCTEAQNGSRLLEISSSQVYEDAKNLKKKISQVKDVQILVGNSSYQKRFQKEGFFTENMNSQEETFAFICMTDCLATWTHYKNANAPAGPDSICTNICETDESKYCAAFVTIPGSTPCWFYSKNDTYNVSNFEGDSLHVINRSMKTTGECLGKLKEKSGLSIANSVIGIISSPVSSGLLVIVVEIAFWL